MFYDEKIKYKSWSNIRKQMNDLLCDVLKNKISYFYTVYRELHNHYGRATINYEGNEIVAFTWPMNNKQWKEEKEILDNSNVDVWHLGNFSEVWQKQKQIEKDLLKEKWMHEGILSDDDFIYAVTSYLNTDIISALNSDNYILRVLAYMDRRVGKRTLIKIKDDVESLSDWVKRFYHIRCRAEGLI